MRKPASKRGDLNKGGKSRHTLQEKTGNVYLRRPKAGLGQSVRMSQTVRNIYGPYKEPGDGSGVPNSPLRTIRSP